MSSVATKTNSSSTEATAPERFKRWKFVRENLGRIIAMGQKQGVFLHKVGDARTTVTEEEEKNEERLRPGDRVNIEVNDISLMHEAIPFLPIPVALVCMTMNVIFPGAGTIFSGIAGLCLGQPRVSAKEGRRLMTLVVNLMIGISQFFTITFFFVGWFWSITWGGLLIIYSMQYREALMKRRQEAVTNAAVKALSKNTFIRSKNVRNLIKSQGSSNPSK